MNARVKVDPVHVRELRDHWQQRLSHDVVEARTLTNDITAWLARYTVPEIREALDASIAKHVKDGKTGTQLEHQTYDALEFVPRILAANRMRQRTPAVTRIWYCRAILRNRISSPWARRHGLDRQYDDMQAFEHLRRLHDHGMEKPEMTKLVKDAMNWGDFIRRVDLALQCPKVGPDESTDQEPAASLEAETESCGGGGPA